MTSSVQRSLIFFLPLFFASMLVGALLAPSITFAQACQSGEDRLSRAFTVTDSFCSQLCQCQSNKYSSGYKLADPVCCCTGKGGGSGGECPEEPTAQGQGKEAPNLFGRLQNAGIVYGGYTATPIAQTVGTIISALLSILGVIFLILIVYAGFEWLMAAGDEKKVGNAINTINRALIGLIIVVAAYAITTFVVNAVQKAAGLPGA